MQKGKVRNFGTFLGLNIITLGIYGLYWLYINLKEINRAFTFNNDENVIKIAQKLFILWITVFIVSTIITMYLWIPQQSNLNPISISLSLISGILALCFFYYFTASVSLGQIKAQLKSFKIKNIYGLYIIGLAFNFLWCFIPDLESLLLIRFLTILIVIGFILVYFEKIQKEINKIWLDGKFEKVNRSNNYCARCNKIIENSLDGKCLECGDTLTSIE